MIISTKTYHREICSRSKKNQAVYKRTLAAAQKLLQYWESFLKTGRKCLESQISALIEIFQRCILHLQIHDCETLQSLCSHFKGFPEEADSDLSHGNMTLFFFFFFWYHKSRIYYFVCLPCILYVLILLVNIIFVSPTALPRE